MCAACVRSYGCRLPRFGAHRQAGRLTRAPSLPSLCSAATKQLCMAQGTGEHQWLDADAMEHQIDSMVETAVSSRALLLPEYLTYRVLCAVCLPWFSLLPWAAKPLWNHYHESHCHYHNQYHYQSHSLGVRAIVNIERAPGAYGGLPDCLPTCPAWLPLLPR